MGVTLIYQEANISCEARPDIKKSVLTNARLQNTATYRNYSREVDEEIRRLESQLSNVSGNPLPPLTIP